VRPAILLLGVAVGACSLFLDEAPDRTCDNDGQCFRAQGEICDLDRSVCIPIPDAPPPLPDADLPDAGIDADLPDADLPDADLPDAMMLHREVSP